MSMGFCSEYLNKTNSLPLDAITEAFVGTNDRRDWMSDKKMHYFSRVINQDYFKSVHAILHNPE